MRSGQWGKGGGGLSDASSHGRRSGRNKPSLSVARCVWTSTRPPHGGGPRPRGSVDRHLELRVVSTFGP